MSGRFRTAPFLMHPEIPVAAILAAPVIKNPPVNPALKGVLCNCLLPAGFQKLGPAGVSPKESFSCNAQTLDSHSRILPWFQGKSSCSPSPEAKIPVFFPQLRGNRYGHIVGWGIKKWQMGKINGENSRRHCMLIPDIPAGERAFISPSCCEPLFPDNHWTKKTVGDEAKDFSPDTPEIMERKNPTPLSLHRVRYNHPAFSVLRYHLG